MADFGFYQYRDIFSQVRKADNTPRTIKEVERTYADFITRVISLIGERNPEIHQGTVELDWYKCGQPYFKIWPSMIGALSHINLNLDCRLIRTRYPSFEVRFPTANNPMREGPDKPDLRSMLVSIIEEDGTRLISLWMDFGEHIPGSEEAAIMTFLRFNLTPGRTVREALTNRPPDRKIAGEPGYYPSEKFQAAILKLAIAVMFFSVDQHEIIAPDIPRKLIERYANLRKSGNQREMSELLKKAKKRLQLPEYSAGGYVIGREIDLPRRTIKDYRESKPASGEKHWEISYGYVRSPHIRMQPVGPRKDPQIEAILISAAPVRPDLPMKQAAFNIKGAEDD